MIQRLLLGLISLFDLIIEMQLAKFSISKEVWDHLAKLYTKVNFAKSYQIEMKICAIE